MNQNPNVNAGESLRRYSARLLQGNDSELDQLMQKLAAARYECSELRAENAGLEATVRALTQEIERAQREARIWLTKLEGVRDALREDARESDGI